MAHEPQREMKDLIARATQGDSAARDELFGYLSDGSRFANAVRSMVRRMLPRDHNARRLVETEDIVQSAVRAGYDQIEKFRGDSEAEFFGWMKSILRGKVSRATRRPENKRRASLANDNDEISDEGASAERAVESLIATELRDELQHAIAALSDNQRLVIELRLRGATTERIAELTDAEPATVRKRESRAVTELRRLVD